MPNHPPPQPASSQPQNARIRKEKREREDGDEDEGVTSSSKRSKREDRGLREGCESNEASASTDEEVIDIEDEPDRTDLHERLGQAFSDYIERHPCLKAMPYPRLRPHQECRLSWGIFMMERFVCRVRAGKKLGALDELRVRRWYHNLEDHDNEAPSSKRSKQENPPIAAVPVASSELEALRAQLDRKDREIARTGEKHQAAIAAIDDRHPPNTS
jgi:hypothetical protein